MISKWGLKIIQINARSSHRTTQFIQEATEDMGDLLLLVETPRRAMVQGEGCIMAETEGARVAMYVLNKGLQYKVPFVSDSRVVIKLNKPNLYIHGWYLIPGKRKDKHSMSPQAEDLEAELLRGRRRTIHMGDFNAHSKEVGGESNDERGKRLFEAAVKGGYVSLNRKRLPTFGVASKNGGTVIDWAMASLDIEAKCDWHTEHVTAGSDHEKIIVTIHDEVITKPVKPRRKIKPSTFLREIKRTTVGKPLNQWHQHMTEAIEKAMFEVDGTKETIVDEQLMETRQRINELKKNLRKQPMRRAEIKAEMNQLTKQYRQRLKQLKNDARGLELAEVKHHNLFKKVKAGKPSRKAEFVSTESGEMRGLEAATSILAKSYPCEERQELRVPIWKPNDDRKLTHDEIAVALAGYTETAPGQDGISFNLLKQWFSKAPEYHLALFNQWYAKGWFPAELRQSMIIPLVKDPTKGTTLDNIRPINLLNTIGKWFEKIVDNRIMQQLETNGMLQDEQYAYREGRGAEMALQHLTDFVRSGGKGHKILVQLDVKGAFDNLQHQAILDEACRKGLPANVMRMLGTYLTDRKVSLTLEGEEATRKMLVGAAQGSSLGPHLYIIATDRVLRRIKREAEKQDGTKTLVIGYADDIVIGIWSGHLKRMKEAVTVLSMAASEELRVLGLEVAANKTKAMMIHGWGAQDTVKVCGEEIHTVNEMKILGVYFTSKNTVSRHLAHVTEKIREKAKKLGDAFRSDMDMNLKKRLYNTCIASIARYGANAWSMDRGEVERRLASATRRTLQQIASAPTLTSGIAASVMTGLPPLHLVCAEDRDRKEELFSGISRETGTEIETGATIAQRRHPSEWKRRGIDKVIKDQQQADSIWADLVYYTDGSRYEEPSDGGSRMVVGAAYVRTSWRLDKQAMLMKLPEYASVMQAEIKAIQEALRDAEAIARAETIAIISDSMSALTAIGNPVTRNEMALECQKMMDDIEKAGSEVQLCWVKAHVNITGNEEADGLAKTAATEGVETETKTPAGRVRSSHRRKMREKYAEHYRKHKSGREIKRYFDDPNDPATKRMRINRSTAMVYSGHGPNKTSYSFGYDNEDSECPCGSEQSMLHVMTECPAFMEDNLTAANNAGIDTPDFQAPWHELKKNKRMHEYICTRAPAVIRQLREDNKEILENRLLVAMLHKMKIDPNAGEKKEGRRRPLLRRNYFILARNNRPDKRMGDPPIYSGLSDEGGSDSD